jgi:hypothetical protein
MEALAGPERQPATGPASGAKAKPVRLQPLPGTGSSLVWEAPQSIQADAKGRVFVLRGDNLSIYPLTPNGELGEPKRLEGPGSFRKPFVRAVMSPTGEWLLYSTFAEPLLLIRNGKIERLPPVGWYTDAVGMLRGNPVANILPLWTGSPPQDKSDPPALLLQYSADRWSRLVSEEVPTKDNQDPLLTALLHRSAVLAEGAKGRLWVANRYVYRVRRFSPAGKQLLEIRVGEREAKQAENPKIEMRFQREAEKNPMAKNSSAVAITAPEVVHTLAEGRDGNLYLLVTAAGVPALDRFDPVRGVLERLPVAFDDIMKIITMAAGRDGLYFAAHFGKGGRYRISWETLEGAAWKTVEEAEVGTVFR